MKVIVSTLTLAVIALGSIGIANAIPPSKMPFSALHKKPNETKVAVSKVTKVTQRPVSIGLLKSSPRADRPTYFQRKILRRGY